MRGGGLFVALAAALGAAIATAPVAPAAAPVAPPAQAADTTAAARKGVRHVYLIRHGQYDRADSIDSRVGNALNALGHEQARLLGARLAAMPVKPRILVSSDYTRARETADDIGALLGMAAARDTLLQECYPPTGRPERDREEDPAEMALCERKLAEAWERYFVPSPQEDVHDILVCHGNVIRRLVLRALGCGAQNWLAMDIGNASLTVVAVRPDGTTRLVLFGDVGHLPVGKQTWVGRGLGLPAPPPAGAPAPPQAPAKAPSR
jgi:serine/threonine-protein phosphatase PGAM5